MLKKPKPRIARLHDLKIGIAGAGLMGRLLALALVKQGAEVTLFDRDSIAGNLSCGKSAAGLLTPFAELDSIEPSITQMGIQALQRWPIILGQLTQLVFFQQSGSLMLAHTQDRSELTRFKQLYQKLWSENSASSITDMKVVGANEINTLEPELAAHFQEGLYFPSEAQISPHDLFSALAKTLQEYGVIWRPQHKVTAIRPHHITCNHSEYKYDWVLDCRGLGSKPDYPSLRGVRGELIELYAPDVELQRIIRLMHPRYALYIVPRLHHRYIVGASSIESEDLSPISVQTTLELLSAAYSLHRGFAEARILQSRVNCRPAFPDNLPHIDYREGLISINGLYRHGFLLAPCLVEQVLAHLRGTC